MKSQTYEEARPGNIRRALREVIKPIVTPSGFLYKIPEFAITFSHPGFIEREELELLEPKLTVPFVMKFYTSWLQCSFEKINSMYYDLDEASARISNLEYRITNDPTKPLYQCIIELSKAYLSRGGKLKALNKLLGLYGLVNLGAFEDITDGKIIGRLFDYKTALTVDEERQRLLDLISECQRKSELDMEELQRATNAAIELSEEKSKKAISEITNEHIEKMELMKEEYESKLECLESNYIEVCRQCVDYEEKMKSEADLKKIIESLTYRLAQQENINKEERVKFRSRFRTVLNTSIAPTCTQDDTQLSRPEVRLAIQPRIDCLLMSEIERLKKICYKQSMAKTSSEFNTKQLLDKKDDEIRELQTKNKALIDKTDCEILDLQIRNKILEGQIAVIKSAKKGEISNELTDSVESKILDFQLSIKPGCDLVANYDKHIGMLPIDTVIYKGVEMLPETVHVAERIGFSGTNDCLELFGKIHDVVLLRTVIRTLPMKVVSKSTEASPSLGPFHVGVLNLRSKFNNVEGIISINPNNCT